jgi:hypothetical protein
VQRGTGNGERGRRRRRRRLERNGRKEGDAISISLALHSPEDRRFSHFHASERKTDVVALSPRLSTIPSEMRARR